MQQLISHKCIFTQPEEYVQVITDRLEQFSQLIHPREHPVSRMDGDPEFSKFDQVLPQWRWRKILLSVGKSQGKRVRQESSSTDAL